MLNWCLYNPYLRALDLEYLESLTFITKHNIYAALLIMTMNMNNAYRTLIN